MKNFKDSVSGVEEAKFRRIDETRAATSPPLRAEAEATVATVDGETPANPDPTRGSSSNSKS